MVLGNDFYRKEMSEDSDIWMSLDGFNQTGLDFGSRIVFVVENTEF